MYFIRILLKNTQSIYKMYIFLAFTSFLKTFNPYFRKHILNTLEPHEYIYLNTFIISLFVFAFFLYKTIFHVNSLDKFLVKIQKLSLIQIMCFMLIAVITVTSSIIIINVDKHYNTPLLNSLFTKSFAAILLVLFSVFIYNENYNYKQLFGILLIIAGLFLISFNK